MAASETFAPVRTSCGLFSQEVTEGRALPPIGAVRVLERRMDKKQTGDWIERINPDVLTRILIGLLIGVAISAMGAVGLYVYEFHGTLASDQAVWAQFG